MIILLAERVFVHYEVLLDAILVPVIVLIYTQIKKPRLISSMLCFLGRHSMNIFLFHTFIYYIWFKDLIYSSRNPLLIYFSLIIPCILISIIIERVKRLLFFDSFQSYIIKKICPTINA